MFRIKHKDDEPERCVYDRCNRKLRGFGYIEETTGSIYCGEECAVRDQTEKAPRVSCLQ
jgi:hypothetical protein